MADIAKFFACHSCGTAMAVTGENGDRYLTGQCSYCNAPHFQSAPGYSDVGLTSTGLAPEAPAESVQDLETQRDALLEQAEVLRVKIEQASADEPEVAAPDPLPLPDEPEDLNAGT
jgi:hypothetical protein